MAVKTKLNISTISYVMIYVKDTEKSVPFYRDTLGAKVKNQEPGWVEFDMGAVTLALHGQEEKHPRTGTGTEVVFAVDNIDEAYETLKAAGVKIEHAPHQVCETPAKIGYSFEVADPDGNILSLFGMKKR